MVEVTSAAVSIWSLIFTIFTFSLYVYVSYYFIFKTDILINKLQLDKNFDQSNFPLNIHRSTVLSVVIKVIRGLLIADNIPYLCRSLYKYFEARSIGDAISTPDYSYIIVYAAKILVGLIFIGNYRFFINFIERKKRNKAIVENSKEEI